MPESVSFWDRTKQYSNTAYNKALKPGFDKAYNVVNKLEPHVNKLSYKVGSESFWPGTLDKESEKAARILRSFCKDGFYDHIDEEAAKKAEADGVDLALRKDVPQGKQRVIMKIPAKVIQNAKGLAIFTCMRTGWVIGGSGGAGVLVGRHPETGEWSPPSGIHMQNLSVGFLIGVDLTDTVLVINTYEALEAFTKLRCTLGTEVAVAAGPLGIGGTMDTEVNKKPSPVWSYVKSRGLYGGVAVDGNVVIERTDENERFYNERVGVAKILVGEVRYPPTEKYKMLLDTIKAAQGDTVDETLLPQGEAPSDLEMAPPGPTFGVPDGDDPDPFGFKALEAQGLSIREAGTHRRATPDSFEFKPSPTSPVYNTYRMSIDASLKRKEYRNSVSSLVSTDRGTQTDEDEVKSPRVIDSPYRQSELFKNSPLRDSLRPKSSSASIDKDDRSISDSGALPPSEPSTALGLGINTEIQHLHDKRVSKDLDVSPAETPKATVGVVELDNKPASVIQTIIEEPTPTKHTDVSSQTVESKSIIEERAKATHADDSNESIESSISKIHSDDSTNDADDDDTDSSDGDFSDFEEAEIITAVPVTAKPKAGVVDIPFRVPPALPPRNPGRASHTPLSEVPPPINFEEVSLDDDHPFPQQDAVPEDVQLGQLSRTASPSNLVGESQHEDEFHSTVATPAEEKREISTAVASH